MQNCDTQLFAHDEHAEVKCFLNKQKAHRSLANSGCKSVRVTMLLLLLISLANVVVSKIELFILS